MLPTLSRMSFLRKLFGEAGTKNVVTLFHEPASQSSVRVLTLLKQAQANSSTTATLDQASDHSPQSEAEHRDFELDVQEGSPTSDQVTTILEYFGGKDVGRVIQGAKDQNEAVNRFRVNAGSFQKPLVVDWNAGNAVVGDNQSEILRLIKSIPKPSGSA